MVGPSGIGSVKSYQRICCSAQKYGPLKISCRQVICAPALGGLGDVVLVLVDHGLLHFCERRVGGATLAA